MLFYLPFCLAYKLWFRSISKQLKAKENWDSTKQKCEPNVKIEGQEKVECFFSNFLLAGMT